MPRPRRPLDAADGAIAEFAPAVQRPRGSADLTLAQVSKTTHYSVSSISEATDGRRLPSWELTRQYVASCGGDPAAWAEQWARAKAAVGTTQRGARADTTAHTVSGADAEAQAAQDIQETQPHEAEGTASQADTDAPDRLRQTDTAPPLTAQPAQTTTRSRTGAREWTWPSSSFLGSLDPDARDRMLALGTMIQYPAGRTVVREADTSSHVLILLDGVVKVTALTRDARVLLLAVRVGGDLVGEMAALDGQPRSATVTTCGTVVARLVSRAEFHACITRDPQIAVRVNNAIAAKLRAATRRSTELTSVPVTTRLSLVLHEIATTHGERRGNAIVVPWPLSQPELASLIGAAEPSVHKSLRLLREVGAVSTSYRSIRVENLELLRQIAQGEHAI